MATEFGKLAARRRIPFPPSVPFPDQGSPEADVLGEIGRRRGEDPWPVEGDFALAYAGPPHPIAERAARLVRGSIFVEWVEDMYPAAFRLEKEAVSMMASLLGAPDGVGFLTTGGTESNISAVRLARDIAGTRVSRPEFILPTSGHFSFRLGAQLLGVRIRDLPIDEATMRPRVEDLARLANRNTVGMACSAPEGAFGQLDPVEEFASFAAERGLYLHVDAAFGGFILPFLRDLGRDVAPFDFSLPGVTSMSTDGHKLGLMPLTTGFFLVRDRELLAQIPTEVTMLHTITSTKPGGTAAAAWAVLRTLGRDGYRRVVAGALTTMDALVAGISSVPGVRIVMAPSITVLCFTSDTLDVAAIAEGLRRRGFGSSYGPINGIPIVRLSISPYRTVRQARRFVAALGETVEELAGG
jgi:glutamate/tyrosine decarboxylase-like PLP-dependent enzyme